MRWSRLAPPPEGVIPLSPQRAPTNGLRVNDPVELFGTDVARGHSGVAQGAAGIGGLVGDSTGFVVADDRGQGGDQHQGLIDILSDLAEVECCPDDVVLPELVTGTRIRAECSTLFMMIHRMALSSKLP
jgi:hypothetical protein